MTGGDNIKSPGSWCRQVFSSPILTSQHPSDLECGRGMHADGCLLHIDHTQNVLHQSAVLSNFRSDGSNSFSIGNNCSVLGYGYFPTVELTQKPIFNQSSIIIKTTKEAQKTHNHPIQLFF